MNNNKLTNIEYSILTNIPIISLFSNISLYTTLKITNKDSYLSILLSILLGFIYLYIFKIINNYKISKSLPQKIKYLYHPFISTIINNIINILFIITKIILTYNLTNLIINNYLNNTPQILITLSILLTTIYITNKGIIPIARSTTIFFIIIIILSLLNISSILPSFNINNLKPIPSYSINNIIKGSIIFTITNLNLIMVTLIIPKNKIINNNKTNKYQTYIYILIMILIFIDTILIIGNLGKYLLNIYISKNLITYNKISITKIKNIVNIRYILSTFITLSLITYYITNTINPKDKQIIIPTIIEIIILILSKLLFQNTKQYNYFIKEIYPIISIITIIIFIIITIKIKNTTKKEA